MTNDEKIEQLQNILSEQISWYRDSKAKEATGERDRSYTYDMAYEKFETMSRGDLEAVLMVLAEQPIYEEREIMKYNPYYYPEELGLKIVGELDEQDMSYEFNMLIVWKDENNNLYYAKDSGCSCPTPFEDYVYEKGGEVPMTPITLGPSLQSFETDVKNFADKSGDKNELINKVKELLNN